MKQTARVIILASVAIVLAFVIAIGYFANRAMASVAVSDVSVSQAAVPASVEAPKQDDQEQKSADVSQVKRYRLRQCIRHNARRDVIRQKQVVVHEPVRPEPIIVEKTLIVKPRRCWLRNAISLVLPPWGCGWYCVI